MVRLHSAASEAPAKRGFSRLRAVWSGIARAALVRQSNHGGANEMTMPTHGQSFGQAMVRLLAPNTANTITGMSDTNTEQDIPEQDIRSELERVREERIQNREKLKDQLRIVRERGQAILEQAIEASIVSDDAHIQAIEGELKRLNGLRVDPGVDLPYDHSKSE